MKEKTHEPSEQKKKKRKKKLLKDEIFIFSSKSWPTYFYGLLNTKRHLDTTKYYNRLFKHTRRKYDFGTRVFEHIVWVIILYTSRITTRIEYNKMHTYECIYVYVYSYACVCTCIMCLHIVYFVLCVQSIQ